MRYELTCCDKAVWSERLREAVRAAALEEPNINGLSPLDVMMRVMVNRYQAGDHVGALAAVAVAALYCHPRLSSADVRVISSVAQLSNVELVRELAELDLRRALLTRPTEADGT